LEGGLFGEDGEVALRDIDLAQRGGETSRASELFESSREIAFVRIMAREIQQFIVA
jgi:hypothetical protein